jgi:hypothetical protein
MSDVASTATPTAAPETNGKPAAGTRELAEHYAKQAILARNKDVADAQAGMEAARGEGDAPAEETATEGTGTPERGKDGKFKPKGAKNAKQAKPADDAQSEGASADGGQGDVAASNVEAAGESGGAASGGLGKARKLIREGNIAGALELIGLHPEKLEGKQWGAFRQREKAAQEAERQAADKEQKLRGLHQELVRHYGAFDEARKAYEAGDYDAAFKIWTGETIDDYQRKRVHEMHTKTKDPEVIKLRKELEALRTEKQTEEQKRQQAAAEQGRAQAREAYRAELATKLSELDDPRFARVAQKQAFVNRVFDIQEQHWNERAQETIDTVEAAELAWEELYEGVAGETSATAAPSVSKSAGTTKTPVRQVAKATTTLNPHEASEASPAHKLKPGSPELRAFYARKAELAALGVAQENDAG